MEFLIEQLSHLSGTAVVALFAYLYGKAQMAHHEASLKRVCDTFQQDTERQAEAVRLLAAEVRGMKSGNSPHNSGVLHG